MRRSTDEHTNKISARLNISTDTTINLLNSEYDGGFKYDIIDVLGIPIVLIEQNKLTSLIQKSLESNRKGWVTGINGHALNLACEFSWMKDFYRHAILNCSEGFGVDVAAFLSGVKIPKRKVWVEWTNDLLQMLEKKDYSLFLLGGTDEVGEKTIKNLHALYPKLRIAGRLNGYSDMSQNDSIIESINRSKPDVVFVALGMPKQEEWIYQNINKLDTAIFFPVGALLDYISGIKKRYPRWMSSLGIGWLYRLLTEPKKVWRRYLIGNPQLVFRALRARFNRS
jgi:N-acetylglucosaminyldiphosphoundecaprenol N-acetyl-beta-D-mannosaminyltransferase